MPALQHSSDWEILHNVCVHKVSRSINTYEDFIFWWFINLWPRPWPRPRDDWPRPRSLWPRPRPRPHSFWPRPRCLWPRPWPHELMASLTSLVTGRWFLLQFQPNWLANNNPRWSLVHQWQAVLEARQEDRHQISEPYFSRRSRDSCATIWQCIIN